MGKVNQNLRDYSLPTQYLGLSRERTKTRGNVGLCGKDEEEIFKVSPAHPPLYSTLRMGPEYRFNPETIGIIILVRESSKRLKDLRHASQLYGGICLFQISYSTLLTIFSQDRILVIISTYDTILEASLPWQLACVFKWILLCFTWHFLFSGQEHWSTARYSIIAATRSFHS